MKSIPQIRIDYSDKDIENRVRRSLRALHYPAFRTLNIAVANGTVTLTGCVPSFYEKQIAVTSSQHVAGVLHLNDEIAVTDPALKAFSNLPLHG